MSRLAVVSLASLVAVVAFALHEPPRAPTLRMPVPAAAASVPGAGTGASSSTQPGSTQTRAVAQQATSSYGRSALLLSFAAGAAISVVGLRLPALLRRRNASRAAAHGVDAIDVTPHESEAGSHLAEGEGENELVTLHDARGLIRYASSSMLAFTGLALTDLIGRPGREIVHPDDWPMLLASVHAARSSDRGEPTMFRARTRRAGYVWVEGEFRHSISRTGEPEMTCVARSVARLAEPDEPRRLPAVRRSNLAAKVLDTTQGPSLQDLCHAFEHKEFVLHYQLKVKLATWEVTGVEALLRWEVPEGSGRTSELIAAAEQSGFIVTLGEWVVRAAARQSLEWRRGGLRYPVSVNISPRQLHDGRFVELMRELVAADRDLPAYLTLEVTEGALAHNADQTVRTLAQLVSMGFTLHIDDFGTGYSRLSHLSRMPVRALKIDRAFVRALSAAPESTETVKAVIALSRALGVGVIAEGVETSEQLELLKSLGCDEAQGYLFARPMSAEAVTALTREPRRK